MALASPGHDGLRGARQLRIHRPQLGREHLAESRGKPPLSRARGVRGFSWWTILGKWWNIHGEGWLFEENPNEMMAKKRLLKENHAFLDGNMCF